MLEIFQYDFMVRALIAGLVIGTLAPLIGMFLVVRRYSLMADTLAHVSLAGVAISAVFGTQPIITAAVTALAAAFGIEQLRTKRTIFGDSVLALFLTGSLAVAVVLFSAVKGINANLLSYLFGSITTVTKTDLVMIVSLGVVVLGLVIGLYRYLFAVSYDEEVAQVQGIPTRILNLIIVMVAAVTVALAMRIVGTLLIGALMVIPVTAATQFGKGFRSTMLLAVLFSLASVLSGLLLSFSLNLASGGTIVVIALLIFIASLALNRKTS